MTKMLKQTIYPVIPSVNKRHCTIKETLHLASPCLYRPTSDTVCQQIIKENCSSPNIFVPLKRKMLLNKTDSIDILFA